MDRLGDAKPMVEAVFRQRLEDVVTGEIVTEMGGKHKVAKPRLLLLCRSMSTAASMSATLNIVSVEDNGRKVKIKQTFVVERIADVSHDGDFDATFNFGASGMLSVSFESHIQREMFIAAVRRIQGSLQSGKQQQGMAGGPVRGVLTDTIGAAAEADAASRVRKLRQEKRRVFSQEEEQHLMKFMNGKSFDDVQRFQEVLLQWQKEAELLSLDSLVKSSEMWGHVKEQVQDLVGEVEELEGRIEHYTTNLLSKKSVIQQIEHENNTLQRQQQNLEELYVILADLRDQLSLSPAATSYLVRLRSEPEASLVNFLSEGQTAATLSAAMKQMHNVLHNKKLVTEFPIAAVSERKVFFLEQRRLIALRSHSYIFSTIGEVEAKYLSDKTRFSRGNTLVWRLHDELSLKLRAVSDILLALPRIDMERYTRTERRYCTSMQKIYTLEISHFLKCLKRNVKKVSKWKGPFMLGTSDTFEEALTTRMETAQAGETPRMWRNSPTASPALTPRMFRFDDDADSHGGGGGGHHSRSSSIGGAGGGGGSSSTGSSSKGQLSIEFPSTAKFPGVDLYADPTVLRRLDAKGAASSVHTGFKSFFGSNTGGNLRPDLAVALALQSAMVVLLYEESLLGDCFGMREEEKKDTDDDLMPFDYQDAERAFNQGDRDPTVPSFKPEEHLQESLMELFGGDRAGLIAPPTDKTDDAPGRNISLAQPPLDNFPHRSFTGGGGGGSIRPGTAANEFGKPTADPTKTTAHKHLKQNYLVQEMTDFAEYMMERCDRLYAIPALCMVKAYRNPNAVPATAKSVFCQSILAEMEKVISTAMMKFIAEQTESIVRCKRKYLIKPTALLHCFTKMPAFVLRMEAVHNALAPYVVDRTVYSSAATSLIDQSFDALDHVTNIKSMAGDGEEKLKFRQSLLQKINIAFDGAEKDIGSTKKAFIQQYRHHAFFCAFYASLPVDSHALDLLHDHYESSKMKRDRYEELYLTRVLFIHDLPVFGVFALSAEDLSSTYSQEELRHHRALAPETVQKVLSKLEKELGSGIRSSAARIKKHFLRDVVPNSTEESFHRTLLQRTWQHYCALLEQKVAFLDQLLKWPLYKDLKMSVSRDELKVMLSSF